MPSRLHTVSLPKVKVIKARPKTYALCGGAYGDEGKGRIVDMLVHDLSLHGPVVVYRDNGGANAGHTVEFPNGERVALHQLPSGAFIKGATVVLGKEMVLHPGDLLAELAQIDKVTVVKTRAKVVIDELAILSLDTHRAYEGVLKQWQSGGKGSTGRGISPAYADVLLRHPLRLRDITEFDEAKVKQHYDMYAAVIKGLGQELAKVDVVTITGETIKVGSRDSFLNRLKVQGNALKPLAKEINSWLADKWADKNVGFVFEKAQAIGIDYRWGLYPDVTASDTTIDGVFSATEGVIDPDLIGIKAGVIKATYMSSVGVRKLPSVMDEKLANRIREDAHEYGSTTKRPRGIAYLDIPALKYYAKVGRLNALMLTHMDVSYLDQPVKICTEYKVGKKTVEYRPDQVYLNRVKPVYMEVPAWDPVKLAKAKTAASLPPQAKRFLKLIEKLIGVPVVLITTGPKRDQAIWVR